MAERHMIHAESVKQWTAEVEDLKAKLAAAEARAQGLEADARRYRWLKENKAARNPEHENVWALTSDPIIRGTTLDAAIDAALAPDSGKERG